MKLKNKVGRTLTALLSVGMLAAGMTVPAYANVDQAAVDAAEAEAETVIEETQPEPDEETPFSSPGNGDLGDEIKNSSKKDFYTIRTQNNNVFYLVIDHAGNTDNVYMLSLVDENDLAEFMDGTTIKPEQQTPQVVIPEETKPAEETQPTVQEEPEKPEKSQSSGGLLMIVILIIAAAGGGYYYLKVYKPKKEEETWESELMETDDGLDTVNEDDDNGEVM